MILKEPPQEETILEIDRMFQCNFGPFPVETLIRFKSATPIKITIDNTLPLLDIH